MAYPPKPPQTGDPASRTLDVPFIEGLSAMPDKELLETLELGGARFYIDSVNWPDRFPYAPLCGGEMAWDKDHLAVHWHVRCMDLRVRGTSDNSRQWEDSCTECFLMEPGGGAYCNFEVNPAGRLLSARGADRHVRTPRTPEELATIRRIASVPCESIEKNGEVFTYDVAILIPFALLGVDEAPGFLRGNLYKCGDKTAHPHYVSWSPIGTPRPDFHCPEYFGTLILQR